jgi:ferric-dicitrate binding protein FerR (iron transport regulator)
MPPMAPPTHPDSDLAVREAAEWFECVHQEDVSLEVLIHFGRWLDADPLHRAHFQSIERICLGVLRIGEHHRPTASELDSDTAPPHVAGGRPGD